MSSVDFLFSERQQKMLAAMLLNPERQFGTNELVAICGPGIGAGRNVIRAFENSGVIAKSAVGNQRLYSINRKHPIYPEIRLICLKKFGFNLYTPAEWKMLADDRVVVSIMSGERIGLIGNI